MYDFLNKDGSFYYFLNLITNLTNKYIVSLLKNYNNSIINIEGDFLNLALKALNLSSIAFFLKDGKTFFNNFYIITTYDGFCGLLESLFLSKEITIETIEGGTININVVNYNQELEAFYIDNIDTEYIEKENKNYLGFFEQEVAGLNNFFKVFLQRFLPAGVILNQINITPHNQKKGIKNGN